eukprot:GHRR01012694.1.p1 GENE.GHRR01012694.1~~GHRR01012694.1.p1  ORF type:complete len:873 (+),score=416.93 GHRR01012694.1:315-2933(+)
MQGAVKSAATGLQASAAPFVPTSSTAPSRQDSGTAGIDSNGTGCPVGQVPVHDAQSAAGAEASGNGNAAAAATKDNGSGNKGPKAGPTAKQAAAVAPTAPPASGIQQAKDPKPAGKQTGKAGKQNQQQQQQGQGLQQQQLLGKQQQQKQQSKQQQQHKDVKDTKEQQKQQLQDQQQQKEQQRQQAKDSKDSKAAGPGAVKMSAAAAAFVPKAATANAAGLGPTGNNSQQQQRPHHAAASPANSRLKSPLKGTPGVNSNSTAAFVAATSRPSSANTSGAGSSSSSGAVNRQSRAGARSDAGTAGVLPGFGPRSGIAVGMANSGGPGGAAGFAGNGLPVRPFSGSLQPSGGAKRALLPHFQGGYGQYGGSIGNNGMYSGGGGYQHPQYQQQYYQQQQQPFGVPPGKQHLSGQFMTERLRQQLQQSNYLRQLQYTASGDEPQLPDKIGHYHTLYPLEDLSAADAAGVSAAWGVRTTVLKGISARDGQAYTLRVVCGKQVIPSLEMLSVVRAAVDAWSSVAGHPGLLVPVEGLVANELDGSPSLVVVHLYCPGALTLMQAHLQPTQTASGQLVRNTPSEEVLWSYTVQLAAVLRATHAAGLALRPAALSATKVLLTPAGRLKACGLGVAEALTGEVVSSSSEELMQLQRDDVLAMGQLLLQLACAAGNLPTPSLDFASMHYSPEFVRLLMLLLGVADGGAFSWRAVSALLGERLLLEMDSLAIFNEQLLGDLSKELDNGRLFRLISKVNFATDRQREGAAAAAAAAAGDVGDRYLLALFKDFVFHQGELDGGRVLDWGHIIENLNKLDAGINEQVLLQSRDERSLLVVSYADIKRCIETAIVELRTKANQPTSGINTLMRPHGVPGMGHMFGLTGR